MQEPAVSDDVVTGSNDEVRTGNGITTDSSQDAAGISGDTSEVPNRLGLSINLSLLQRQPSTPAASSTPFSDIASWVGPFVELVGPTKPLPSTATAINFFSQIFDDDLLSHIVEQTNLHVRQNVQHHTSGKT